MSDRSGTVGPGGAPPLRVLQLIGDTDAIAGHVAAVELHRGLALQGLEVRTLALAPGSVGGLEELVPAVSHARRSLAARTQVTQERRWADVVVLHGPRVDAPATWRRRGDRPPTVVAVPTPADADGAEPDARTGLLRRRVLAAATVLVVDDEDRAAKVARRWGRPVAEVAVADGPAAWADVLASVVDDRGDGAR